MATTLNPMTQTETQAGVSDYAMPYVTSMLGATQNQLFNIDPSGNITGLKGYTPYSYNAADYFAGFTPLQQQAQQGVANLSLPSTFGQGIGLTGQTYGNLMGLGQQAGMAGQNYANMATNPYAISSYMNPYLMNSLAPQMQLLGQQQAQQANQLAGQATQAGAFGGSRYGIQKGLQDQSNQLAMSNLVGQGYNNAYNQALQNMQFGANLGLQGQQAAAGMYGQGLNAANQLANIGNQALQAQQGILGAQQQTGATQQGLQQQVLNQAVQNYNTAQQYPYQQLGFMQNMLQGLPISTQSQQYYQQAPSMMQNLAALGMGMYGLNSLLGGTGGATGTGTSGGTGIGGITSGLNTLGSGLTGAYNWLTGSGSGTSSLSGTLSNIGSGLSSGWNSLTSALGFAEGGSVESQGNVESIVSKLSDGQLQQAAQAAQARGDFQQLQAIQEEVATRASERGGLAGAFNQLPQQTRAQFAGGGMVAFAKGGESEDDDEDGTTAQPQTDQPSPGNPVAYAQLGPLAVQAAQRLQNMPDFASMTPSQRAAAEQAYIADAQKAAGASPYGGLRDYLAQADTDRGAALEQGKGLAALSAMSGMLQPGGFMRGLGAAGGAFASHYGQALAADRVEKRSIAQMQFNLADAERKERMGLHRDAQAAVQNAEANRLNAYKAKIAKEQASANALARTAQAMKPTAAKTGSGPKLNEQLAAAEIAYENNPNDQTLKNVAALRRAVAQAKTSDIGGTKADLERARIQSAEDAKALEARTKAAYLPEYLGLKTEQEKKAFLKSKEDEARSVFRNQQKNDVTKLD